jgi:hypothetical protein
MPIEMLRIFDGGESISSPIAVCDACDKEIENAGRAWCVWFYESLEAGERVPAYFAHKGACVNRLEEMHVGPMRSGEMKEFITFLARNIGIDTSKPFPYPNEEQRHV